jgi:hypothetical protein
MKTKTVLIILATMLLSTVHSSAQDTLINQKFFPKGITLKYGFGSYAVKDEYISNEKYSGTLSYTAFSWTREHSKTVYRLEMAYRNSKEINNHNVSADIIQFTLNQGFLYPLKKMSLFKKDLYAWLGPSTDLFFYYNKPDIAVSGFDYAESFAGLISLGLNTDIIYPLNRHFQLESALRFTVISFGLRMVDYEETDESPAKLLTLFKGLNSLFNLGVRYTFLNRLSLKIAYQFEMIRISAWEPLHSASDNVVFCLTFHL